MEGFTPIKNYETYAVNQQGEILDLRSKKLVKQYPNHNTGGYLQVSLINENGYKSLRVHRIVAETFIPIIEDKPTVDHIDRNVKNNNVNNLRWSNLSQQQINKHSWSKCLHKYIYFEDLSTKKNPIASWVISIKNKELNYRKRFNSKDYTLEEVVKIRNDILYENNCMHFI